MTYHFALLFGILVVCSSFAPIYSSQAQLNPNSSEYLTSDPFTDYEKECPAGLAVISFQYRPVHTSRSENDTNAIKGRAGILLNDISLKARCVRHVDDKALTLLLAANEINDTSIKCRYGESFNVKATVSSIDYSRMCKPGEYIAGASSMFWNNSRLIRLKCCQVPNVLVHDKNFGCYTMNVDQLDNSIRSNTRGTDGCPTDVLTGVSMTNGTVVGRYCSLSVAGVGYSNTTCKQDRLREILSQRTITTTPSPKSESIIRQNLQEFAPGQRTIPGSSFKVECNQSQAISGFTVEPYFFADSSRPSDLVYSFSCSSIGGGNQTAVRRRYSTFSPTVYAEIDCYKNNAALCGVYSDFDQKTRNRTFSYACCEYSNSVLTKPNSAFQTFMVNGSSTVNSANKTGQFIQRLVMQASTPGSDFFKVSFSVFNYTNVTAFTESSTAEIGRRQRANEATAAYGIKILTIVLASLVLCQEYWPH